MAVVTPEEARNRRKVNLNREDIRRNNPVWDEIFVDDYENKGENLTEIEIQVTDNTDAIEANTAAIAVNTADIATNTANIATNTTDIATNASNISTNTANIATNTGNIATNTSNISTNAGNIATNTTNITTVTNNFNAHDASNSEHGVTGDNVGTGNFAQTAIGGVVLLADLVSDVSATTTVIVTADVGAAPVAYSQAYADQQTALINECKSKINSLINNDVLDLITQFNDLLQQMKDANQMNTV